MKSRKTLLKRRSTSHELDEAVAADFCDTFKSLCSQFRDYDRKRYQEILGIQSTFLTEIKADYKFRADGLPEVLLMVLLNCCSFTEIKEEFGRFLIEFDDNSDGKLQHAELVMCLEKLSDENYIGKAKVRLALVAMGIEVDVGVSFLKEGSQKKALIDTQISGQLKELFHAKGGEGRKKLDSIDIKSLLPYLLAFWLEFEIRKVLKRNLTFREIKGLPLKPGPDGSFVYDPAGKPSGLYYALLLQFESVTDLDEACLTFRHIIRGIETFRNFGYSVLITQNDLPYEAADYVLQKVKEFMGVDSYSSIESRLFSFNEILSPLTLWVCQQSIRARLRATFGSHLTHSQMRFVRLTPGIPQTVCLRYLGSFKNRVLD